ncbi:MAG: flagellar export chaperone FliS [Deferrisomatales bacterium]|nr:flagellar export chaperone FliS [Deferrisomatales bacterium]
MYSTGAQAYTHTQVATTTNQQHLIVMAYDGIIRFLGRAKDQMAEGEIEATHNSLVKARAVIEELASTLNMEQGGKIAENLWNLYVFFMQKITEANYRKAPGPIDDILPSIQELRSAWAELEISEDDAETRALNHRVPRAEDTYRVSITG